MDKDAEVDALIARAFAMPSVTDGIEELERHRLALVASDAHHPALRRFFEALDQLAGRQMDFALRRRVMEEQAEWLEATAGPTAAETVHAWGNVAVEADLDFDWPRAIRAWERVERAVPDDGPQELLYDLSAALCGLSTRRSAAGDLPAARALGERNVLVCRRIGSPERLAMSLRNLAYWYEQAGDLDPAADLLRQEQIVLERAFPVGDYRIRLAKERFAKLEAKRQSI